MKVKEVSLYQKGIVYQKHHNRAYWLENYIEVEFINGQKNILNIDGNCDITNCNYIKLIKPGILKKRLFVNTEYFNNL